MIVTRLSRAGWTIRGIVASVGLTLAASAPLAAAESIARFHIEEATIDSIQAAILKGELTSTQVVQLYLKRIKAYDGPCVSQPEGILGPAIIVAQVRYFKT